MVLSMEYIALALESDQSHLLKKARLKISEWLDSERRGSHVVATVYLEFSDSGEQHKIDHVYVVVPEAYLERITFPGFQEIEEENSILEKRELSKKINIKNRFIPPISLKNVYKYKKSEEHGLIRIDLKEFEIDDTNTNRFQFRFYIKDSLRKNPSSSDGPYWDWSYEAPMNPLVLGKDEFENITQIKMDLEFWVMIEPAMCESVSDLNIRSTRPFDRFVILPDNTAREFERDFIKPKTLCIRWFFPGFSETGLSAGIMVDRKKSVMEMERKYTDKVNSDPNHFFCTVSDILNVSRITCIDFEFISARLETPEFSKILEILSQLLYHRDDHAYSRLEELVNIMEGYQDLKYGKYYFSMFNLLNQMRICKGVRDIFASHIRRSLNEFLNESEYINMIIHNLFKDFKLLIDLIEQFYYYSNPEDKYKQKKDILKELTRLRDIAEDKLINPESYLISEEILLRWERIVEEEIKQSVKPPELNVELKTRRLLDSERIHLIFDITNISDVPLVHLEASILPSEEYIIHEQKMGETTKRRLLTKSDDILKSDESKERIFSPIFMISPKKSPNVSVRIEIDAVTEEEKKFIRVYDVEVELFSDHEDFRKIEQNPYIVGKPVKTQQMFFGRKDTFDQIRCTIAGVSVNQAIVYGQYRIGKTSVLYQLMNKLDEEHSRLNEEYIPVLAITHGMDTKDSELLRFWSENISSAFRHKRREVPELPNYEESANPYRRFQEYVNEIMERLEDGKIIFLIDEYDLIDDLIQERKISMEIFQLLDWMIKHDKIELIIAGRSSMDALKTEKWKEIARPFVKIKLPPLDEESTRRLITEPVRESLKYDDSAIEKIIRLTNCHPYLTQLCCHVLVLYHNLKKKNVITYSDVENCIPEILDMGQYGFVAMILADTTPDEQIVLRAMVSGLRERTSISERELVVSIREYNPRISDENIREAISRLKEKDIIRSATEEMIRYKFICELFKYWVDLRMEPLSKNP
jgi:hypothetical protein